MSREPADMEDLLQRIHFEKLQVQKHQHGLAVLQAQYNRQCNKQALIAKIPLDVWLTIFRFARAQHPSGILPIEIRASHVSSDWRSTVIGVASLWRNINLLIRPPGFEPKYDMRSGWVAPQVLELYLKRSTTSALDITIKLDACWEDVLQMLAPHAHRWRSLNLYSSETILPPSCINTLAPLFTPLLERLSLSGSRNAEMLESPVGEYPCPAFPTIFTGGAPRLHKVIIPGGPFELFYPPLQYITSFNFTGLEVPANNTYLRAALTCMPHLANLILSFTDVDDDLPATKPRPSILFRDLQSVTLVEHPDQNWLLRTISAPNLKHVELCSMSTRSSTHGCFPSVTTLIIRGATYVEEEPISKDIVSVFPNVEHLIIDEDDHAVDCGYPVLGFSLGPTLQEGTEPVDVVLPWPQLDTLTLWQMECLAPDVEDDAFIKGLRERQEAGGRLKTIVVPEDAFDEFPDHCNAFLQIVDHCDAFVEIMNLEW